MFVVDFCFCLFRACLPAFDENPLNENGAQPGSSFRAAKEACRSRGKTVRGWDAAPA